jgi:hypothetical protein
MTPMTPGFWITWYDLPERARDEQLAWTHDEYIPKVLATAGVRAAAHYAAESQGSMHFAGTLKKSADPSLPAGWRYILIVGGEDAHVFVRPTPAAFHATLPERDRKMLALRIGERSNIMIVEAEVRGPDGKKADDMAFSPAIQLGSYNAASYEDEDELAAWYAQWRLPLSMGTLPGCVRVRKLVSVSGWAKHACFHEFTSLEMRNRHYAGHEKSNPEMAAWGHKVVAKLLHAPGSPTVARRIWPPVE